MLERAIPPEDIEPADFFRSWVPERVAADAKRRESLVGTDALLEFALQGDGGGAFTLRIADGRVQGAVGAAAAPDLRVLLDVPTWRELNRGSLSAPEAFLRRRVRLEGNIALAVKLHLILG